MYFQENKKEKKGEEQADKSPLKALLERLLVFSMLWTEAERGLGKGRHLFFFSFGMCY